MTSANNPWSPSNWAVSDDAFENKPLPHISIGVLNYNRREALRQTLDVLTIAIQYSSYEIIVVDNGSTDGSIEMVRSEYPSVILHEVGVNRGVSSRNIQTELATGKYLFSFDDDTYPASPAMVLRIVEYLESNPGISGLCGKIYQPVTGVEEMQDWVKLAQDAPHGVELFSPAEGGICFRTSDLKEVDGYEPRFVYGAEGRELTVQFYKLGHVLWFHPSFATLHFPPIGRTLHTRAYLQWRHTIWMFAKHWPVSWLAVLLPAWTFRRLFYILFHPRLAGVSAKGWWEGIARMGPFLKYHPKLTHKQAASLTRFYLQLFRW